MLKIIFLFIMIPFIFSEDIFYLPGDTFFSVVFSKEDISPSKKEYSLVYGKLRDHDEWDGGIGYLRLTLEFNDKTITSIRKIVNKSTDEIFCMFFYDISFDLQKHSFNKNYNPNIWYWMKKYNSRDLYRKKEVAKKNNDIKKLKELAEITKKSDLSKNAPVPLRVSLPTEESIDQKTKDLIECVYGKNLSNKKIKKILMYRVPIRLKKNSKYSIYIISSSDFRNFTKKGNHALIYKLDDTDYNVYNYRNKKWSQNR